MTLGDENLTETSRFWNLLLFGSLIMLFAEVMASASSIWFVDPFRLIITFPLYLGHSLFYYNLAKRTHRFEIRMLYFWGMYYALYEAPITKVLFAGYFNQDPILGLVAGIAVFEFVTLVFYWHPIQSFIIPVLFFEWFAVQSNSEEWLRIPESHRKYLLNTRKTRIFLLFQLLFFTSLLPLVSQFNVVLVVASFGGNVLLIYLSKRMATRGGKAISTDALLLGKKGFSLLVLYLILLYSVLGAFLRKEAWPITWQPYLIIVLAIALITLVIWKKGRKESTSRQGQELSASSILSSKRINQFFLGIILFSALYSLIPPLGWVIAIVSFLLIPLIGLGVLARILWDIR